MINSTSPFQRTILPAEAAASQNGGATRAARPGTDQLSTAGAELVQARLASDPAVRADVVARGRALATDPNYPSMQIMGSVARMIVASPDPSDDES